VTDDVGNVDSARLRLTPPGSETRLSHTTTWETTQTFLAVSAKTTSSAVSAKTARNSP